MASSAALADRIAGCGNAEDRAEHRTDAGRPAEGESKSHDIGAGKRRRLSAALKACLAGQKTDPENAKKIQAHDNDDQAAELGQEIEMLAQKHTDCRGARPERHEDGRETKGEEQRRFEHRPACPAPDRSPRRHRRGTARPKYPPYNTDRAARAAARREKETTARRQEARSAGIFRQSTRVAPDSRPFREPAFHAQVMASSGECQSPFRTPAEKRQIAAFLLFLRVDHTGSPAYVPRTFKDALTAATGERSSVGRATDF